MKSSAPELGLSEAKLPAKEVFYSKLNDKPKSSKEEEYEHAQKLWKVL